MSSSEQSQPVPTDEMDEIFIEHPFRQFVAMYMRNYAAVAGLAIFVTIIGAALLAPIVLDMDPFEMVDAPLLPPGEGGHIFGTDNLGRDMFIAIVYGDHLEVFVREADLHHLLDGDAVVGEQQGSGHAFLPWVEPS